MNLTHIFQIPPLSDWLHLLLLFLGIFLLIFISEIIRKKLNWGQQATRKVVHISVGLLMLLTPIFLETSLPLLSIAAFFTLFNYIAIRKQLLPGMHISRDNLGTVYYPFSFLVLVLLFWAQYKVIVIASVMVMAIGDAAAAIVGEALSKSHRYRLIQDEKSFEGSATMLLVSAAAIFITFLFFPSQIGALSNNYLLLYGISFLTALVATAGEALGNRGNDNLIVPLLTGAVLYFFLTGNSHLYFQFFMGTLLGLFIAFLSLKLKFLSASGAVTTFLLATLIYGFGGWTWTVPVLTFFVLSSLLSKIGKRKKARFDLIFEKGDRRDAGQVFANGGIAGLLMILFVFVPDKVIYLMYLASLAAAAADTWATEIGVLWGNNPRLIYNLKPVPAGTSGGVTLSGFAAALLGAGFIGVSGMFFPLAQTAWRSAGILVLIAGAGFFGSLIDSLLGATLQAQYRCDICGKITESKIHCQKPTRLVTGISRIDNDRVNFLNTLSGAGFFLLCFWLSARVV